MPHCQICAKYYEMLRFRNPLIVHHLQISFASVSVPAYNSEMAPPHLRGRMNQLYQIVLTFFILVAQTINLIINVTHAVRWGWRLSLGFAFVPSFILFIGELASVYMIIPGFEPALVGVLPCW